MWRGRSGGCQGAEGGAEPPRPAPLAPRSGAATQAALGGWTGRQVARRGPEAPHPFPCGPCRNGHVGRGSPTTAGGCPLPPPEPRACRVQLVFDTGTFCFAVGGAGKERDADRCPGGLSHIWSRPPGRELATLSLAGWVTGNAAPRRTRSQVRAQSRPSRSSATWAGRASSGAGLSGAAPGPPRNFRSAPVPETRLRKRCAQPPRTGRLRQDSWPGLPRAYLGSQSAFLPGARAATRPWRAAPAQFPMARS